MTEANNYLTDSSGALGRDIRYLGNILGDIIRLQGGKATFDLVEEVRAAAKARRSGDASATQSLKQIIENLTLENKVDLIKSFGNYFQLINIAEDQQRVRTLRQREQDNELKESIELAISELKQRGYSAEDMHKLLQRVAVRLVLTAHPSEAKRQEVLVKLSDIADMMTIRERQSLLPREEAHYIAAISRRVEQLWQTRPTRANRATVADEVQFGLFFITKYIMDVTLNIYTDLVNSLNTHYPDADWSAVPPVLRFASWIGGDRDGNPNVTPEVTLRTIESLRKAAREVYKVDVDYIRDRLTQSIDEISFSEPMYALETNDPEATPYAGELYRQHLNAIHERLENNSYKTGEALLADLYPIYESLISNRGTYSAGGTLQRLIMKVKLFGLHLVPLEVREDARNHAAAISEIFTHYKISPDFSALSEPEKQALLIEEINNPRPLLPIEPAFSETSNRVIQTWRMVAQAHQRYGKSVIDTFIASMSQQPSDVLIMHLLAKEVGIDSDIDIVPLFETVEDLEHAPQVMSTLFEIPSYRKHLTYRGHRQQIMIGYSDSNKDGGYIASNWSLYTAQQTLAETCEEKGILLELFHGRGGSIGRGGGPTNRAILSQPPASMQGPIKITEQGEVIAYRYGNSDIARRHLNQVMNAALLATSTSTQLEIKPEWRDAMNQLSELGRVAYRQFVYENPGFLDYWQQATPINELASMPIGSRPAKRKKGGFDAIRAIPWVFSWMQSRAIIPSWYGVGHALSTYIGNTVDKLLILQEMYDQWPFFRALIENVQLDVAKADMGIAALYSDLVTDEALRDRIFSDLQAEHELATRYICRIVRQEELLDKMPVIKRSIERRNPYVDPLNFIQVNLLRDLRAMQPDHPEYDDVLQAVLSTINGIAAGMKTTG